MLINFSFYGNNDSMFWYGLIILANY